MPVRPCDWLAAIRALEPEVDQVAASQVLPMLLWKELPDSQPSLLF